MTKPKFGMRALAEHYRECRRRYPGETLLIVFDIDGTLLMPGQVIDGAVGSDTRLPQPFPGALETLRWFQMQPNTDVALNSGRPEARRDETLRTMTLLGERHKVHFDNQRLAMNPYGLNQVVRSKCEALDRFRANGYRVVAMVDDQPENAESMAQSDSCGDTLYLLAHRLFAGTRRPSDSSKMQPAPVVSGDGFTFDGLIEPSDVSRRVRLVCGQLETREELLTFFRSSIDWGRLAVCRGETGGTELVGRFPEGPLSLETALAGINTALKSISIQLYGDCHLADSVHELLAWYGLSSSQLSFIVDKANAETVAYLKEKYPHACLQRTVPPDVYADGENANDWLKSMQALGVSRLSVNWWDGEENQVAGRLLDQGWEVDIVGADDADSFLRAILLLPTSVTTKLVLSNWQEVSTAA
ncbi:MAG: hypothetical protein VX223_00950 [Myxococcota bacterium]|nr:hypothetical protein [Myxococcota bacterium]